MKLVIDRPSWLRGESDFRSKLLRSEDNKKCCLGFYSLACGLPEEAIRDRGTVTNACFGGSYPVPEEMQFLVHGRISSEVGGQLMRINDNSNISDDEREKQLTSIFASHGVEVEFIN